MSDGSIRRAWVSPRRCGVPSCERPVKARGLCASHAARQKKGQPLDPPFKRPGGTTSALAAAISKKISAESAPISPEEVQAISQRLSNASELLSSLPLDVRVLALVMIVTGDGASHIDSEDADPREYGRRFAHAA